MTRVLGPEHVPRGFTIATAACVEAGDPDSIAFVHGAGLDYVSRSPLRIPIATVASAQAAIAGSYLLAQLGDRGRERRYRGCGVVALGAQPNDGAPSGTQR